VVELFTALGFSESPRLKSRVGAFCRQKTAPHASQVERTPKRVRTPWTGFAAHQPLTRFEPSRTSKTQMSLQGFSLSPRFIGVLTYRIEQRDYSFTGPFLAYKASGRPERSITPLSLRRAGQATLMASGSTGHHHLQGGKPRVP
jgi:hypothetical protein